MPIDWVGYGIGATAVLTGIIICAILIARRKEMEP